MDEPRLKPDIINGSFEFIAGFLLWNNVRVLHKDRQVRGVSILTTAFFSLWGFWNLIYYPFLGQWFSAIAGINVVAANSTWVILMIRFKRKPRS